MPRIASSEVTASIRILIILFFLLLTTTTLLSTNSIHVLVICKHAQEVSTLQKLIPSSFDHPPKLMLTQFHSGVARSLGRSAFARPSITRRAFEPLQRQALPAIAQRWASTEAANDGKIHQVIGAVVDGMKILPSSNQELFKSSAPQSSRPNCFPNWR